MSENLNEHSSQVPASFLLALPSKPLPSPQRVILPLLYHLFQGGAEVTNPVTLCRPGYSLDESLTDGSLVTKVPTVHQEQFGVQFLSIQYLLKHVAQSLVLSSTH